MEDKPDEEQKKDVLVSEAIATMDGKSSSPPELDNSKDAFDDILSKLGDLSIDDKKDLDTKIKDIEESENKLEEYNQIESLEEDKQVKDLKTHPTQKKVLIKKGRGFKEVSQSVLKDKDIETKDTNSADDFIGSTPKKEPSLRNNQQKPSGSRERNTAVANRMIRFALGVSSPLSEKGRDQEKRLKDAKDKRDGKS